MGGITGIREGKEAQAAEEAGIAFDKNIAEITARRAKAAEREALEKARREREAARRKRLLAEERLAARFTAQAATSKRTGERPGIHRHPPHCTQTRAVCKI